MTSSLAVVQSPPKPCVRPPVERLAFIGSKSLRVRRRQKANIHADLQWLYSHFKQPMPSSSVIFWVLLESACYGPCTLILDRHTQFGQRHHTHLWELR